MSWLDAASGYQVRLDEDGRVRCRNAKGRLLASVPGSLKDDPQVVQLRQLAEWLTRHSQECLATVDSWMVRSLPVPTSVITEVWADAAWSGALRDLVVTADDGSGPETGFLRDADPERGLGVVTLDGDTLRLKPELVSIPHPVLLEDLDELREFGAELGVEQKVQQLFRQTFARPANQPVNRRSVDDFAGGRFNELNHAVARCRTLGYPVRGGDAVYSAFEDGRTVEARFWIGSDYPESETTTESLSWTLENGTSLPLTEVGPVAWSEGMRMASSIYAGRVVDETVAA
ncbi:DUF4132 domain-containing protein [Actinoalloteichus hymeniacidonis]|uniref:DUF4132 family protein n=1 Tax=Actinoalloteichus hymeniacidonis TaxID=340345 RepID=A0AAC9N010_9PSEU|nr:DUF4132 domain-containing protein [Actinoalloteichus hymeniacidonis]AOS64592.1 putative DUF4132 family protein [Actinoalloteichus hymeniacidonis]MBB5907336.1 hypothetical protein [Actinoalloteichus hymeniacidonis]